MTEQPLIPTTLVIRTQSLLDMHWQIYEAMVKDQNAGGSAAYYVAQLACTTEVFQSKGIVNSSRVFPFASSDVPRTAEGVLVFDTQQLLDLHWATVAAMEAQEKEKCGSGGYALAQAICLGEILKLGGLKFDRPFDTPRSVN